MGHDIYAFRPMVKEDALAMNRFEIGSRPVLERAVERVRLESGEDSDIYRLGLQRLAEWDAFTVSEKCNYEMGYIGGHGNKITAFYEAVGHPDRAPFCSGVGDFVLTKADLPTIEHGLRQLAPRREELGFESTYTLVESIMQALQHPLIERVKVKAH